MPDACSIKASHWGIWDLTGMTTQVINHILKGGGYTASVTALTIIKLDFLKLFGPPLTNKCMKYDLSLKWTSLLINYKAARWSKLHILWWGQSVFILINMHQSMTVSSFTSFFVFDRFLLASQHLINPSGCFNPSSKLQSLVEIMNSK